MYCSFYNIIIVSCQAPLELRGTKFINVDENSTWFVGSRLTYSCEEGFQLLDSEGIHQGTQAVGVCKEFGSWKFDSHCQGLCCFINISKFVSTYLSLLVIFF